MDKCDCGLEIDCNNCEYREVLIWQEPCSGCNEFDEFKCAICKKEKSPLTDDLTKT